jgi:hypothetical protein
MQLVCVIVLSTWCDITRSTHAVSGVYSDHVSPSVAIYAQVTSVTSEPVQFLSFPIHVAMASSGDPADEGRVCPSMIVELCSQLARVERRRTEILRVLQPLLEACAHPYDNVIRRRCRAAIRTHRAAVAARIYICMIRHRCSDVDMH